LWWTKRHWGRFSPSTSVSLANHSTNFSIIIITRGWHNRPVGSLSAEWTQLDSTPTIPIKKNVPPGRFLVLTSFSGSVDLRGMHHLIHNHPPMYHILRFLETNPQPTSQTHILILSSHTCQDLPSRLFPSGYQTTNF
jgi:hypothetical protein